LSKKRKTRLYHNQSSSCLGAFVVGIFVEKEEEGSDYMMPMNLMSSLAIIIKV